MQRLLIALAVSIACASAAQAFMLTAVVKDKDGAPKILGYGFGNDRQACIARWRPSRRCSLKRSLFSRVPQNEPKKGPERSSSCWPALRCRCRMFSLMMYATNASIGAS
jgi:hypothetical protein